jgi:Cd2+/Zn2+-exporting ATPase
VEAWYEQQRYLAGSRAFLAARGIAAPIGDEAASLVYVAEGNDFLGTVAISDQIKADALEAVSRLQDSGLACYLLSGDREGPTSQVAARLGLDGYRSGLMPEDKIIAFDQLAGLDRAMFVGDGINDAPLLANAKVGVAMGGLGSAAAMEVADAVVLNDSPAKIAVLLNIAAHSKIVAWQNIILALGVKFLIMLLGIAGLASLWEAVFADVGVAMLAVLNATRTINSRY